ncbi:N-acetylglutamate synthase-like GNAT family acetyltransferase [Hydrogenispora ethanolica]|uniref:N-acetylglutamate synthase-like GNAT family acetyltransferase n=1 Tax=Hydrogenispora ethanolica TaxID=1082276 RepID=A0A4R1S197_HYDET|nr:GNAT family N-acetyltransferase [Hydrogenispora ethanolica]TCL72310.1 N-acetylglutamate synthase-like GNAT family acetyltransferase [Hydrogenispora ethanolica]
MIRTARPEDAPAIQVLYEILCPGLPVRVLPERIAAIDTDPRNFLLVAEAAGRVVGTAFLTVALSPMFGTQPFGVIEYLVVDPGARGRGVGGRLMEQLLDICRAQHCTAVLLASSAHRTRAHAFFVRHGFDGDAKKGFVNYLNRKS